MNHVVSKLLVVAKPLFDFITRPMAKTFFQMLQVGKLELVACPQLHVRKQVVSKLVFVLLRLYSFLILSMHI